MSIFENHARRECFVLGKEHNSICFNINLFGPILLSLFCLFIFFGLLHLTIGGTKDVERKKKPRDFWGWFSSFLFFFVFSHNFVCIMFFLQSLLIWLNFIIKLYFFLLLKKHLVKSPTSILLKIKTSSVIPPLLFNCCF